MARPSFRGILVPAMTPFTSELDPNADAFVEHCRWLLDQGADGLAIFGTTSEANSVGVEERMQLLEYLLDNGIPAASLMPGTGTCALTDTVRLTAHAVTSGCRGVLMLPPFYYKRVDDDGLFASFSEIIERVGDAELRVYLYHIPPIAQVGFSLDLIGRLLAAYPETIVGLKDSSSDWSNTSAILREYPNLATFCGSEDFLLETMRHGGAGSITATGNVNPAGIRVLFDHWREPEAERLQQNLSSIRGCFAGYSAIPALKSIVADFHDDSDWRTVRPPLRALNDAEAATLLASLRSAGFRMSETSSAEGALAENA